MFSGFFLIIFKNESSDSLQSFMAAIAARGNFTQPAPLAEFELPVFPESGICKNSGSGIRLCGQQNAAYKSLRVSKDI